MLLELAAESDQNALERETVQSSPPLRRLYAEISAELPAADCARNLPTAGTAAADGDTASMLRVLALRGDHSTALSLIDAEWQHALQTATYGRGVDPRGGRPRRPADSTGGDRGGANTDRGPGATADAQDAVRDLRSLQLKSARSLRSIGCHALCAAALCADALPTAATGDEGQTGLADGGGNARSGAVGEQGRRTAGQAAGGEGGGDGDDLSSRWQRAGLGAGGGVEAQIRELKAECAWRLATWDVGSAAADGWSAQLAADLDEPPAWSEGGVAGTAHGEWQRGFHERLHAAIAAMAGGHSPLAQAQLQACLIEQVSRHEMWDPQPPLPLKPPFRHSPAPPHPHTSRLAPPSFTDTPCHALSRPSPSNDTH